MLDMVIMNWMLLMIVTTLILMTWMVVMNMVMGMSMTTLIMTVVMNMIFSIALTWMNGGKKKNRTGLMLISLAVKIQLLMMTMMLKRWR